MDCKQSPYHAAFIKLCRNNAKQKCGACIVAKAQHSFRLTFGAQAILIKLRRRFGAHRIAADEAQHQCRGAVAGQVKERTHDAR